MWYRKTWPDYIDAAFKYLLLSLVAAWLVSSILVNAVMTWLMLNWNY